jgi:hypothetical protein
MIAQVMPPSPATTTNRMRSESLDVFSSYMSNRLLFSSKPKAKIVDPSSVDYWLPEFEDTSKESKSFEDYSDALVNG